MKGLLKSKRLGIGVLPEDHWFVHFMWTVFFFMLPLVRDGHLATVLSMLALSPWFAQPQTWKEKFQNRGYLLGLGGLYLLLLIGMLYSGDQAFGWDFLHRQYMQLLVPLLCIVYSNFLIQHLKRYLWQWLFFVFIASLLVLVFNLLPDHLAQPIIDFLHMRKRVNSNFWEFGMYVPFMNKVQFSHLVALTTLAGFWLWIINHRRGSTGIMVIFLLVFSFPLGGRGATLALLVGLSMLAYGYLFRRFFPKISERMGRRKAQVLTIIAPMLLLVGFFWASIQIPAVTQRYGKITKEFDIYYSGEVYNQPNHITAHQTTISRIVAYEYYWKAIQEHGFWLGVGTGDLAQVSNLYYDNDSLLVRNHFHTQYLSIWLAIGLVGLILFLTCWFGVVFYIFKNNIHASWMLWSLVLFYLVSFIPDAMLKMQTASSLFGLSFCFISFMPNARNGRA